MSAAIQNDPAVAEARRLVGQALSYIDTLHLGPLDWNAAQAIDALQAAAKTIDQLSRDRPKDDVGVGGTAAGCSERACHPTDPHCEWPECFQATKP